MSLNAGRLKKHIEIWRYGSTVNAGEIRPARGSEYTEYYKEQHDLSVRITIRYYEDLRPTDVLMYHGRQFLIQSIVNPEEQNYILEVMCTEKTDKHKPEVS